MALKLRAVPEALPVGTEEFLHVLDSVVPRDIIRPGDSVEQAVYQSGARDLVDFLLHRWEAERFPEAEKPGDWYDGDESMKSYVEGNW